LNGTTYGLKSNTGSTTGSTGFVHVSFTIATTGQYQLVWEVCDVLDHNRASTLAIDNVKLNSTLLYGFESGTPAGFTSLGKVGTSTAITNLSPTEGTHFAYLDTTGNVAPIFNTGPDGSAATLGSRLISSAFSATAGQVLSLDLAFLTNDADPDDDYAVAALQPVPVPEPSSLLQLATALVCLAGAAWLRAPRNEPVIPLNVDPPRAEAESWTLL